MRRLSRLVIGFVVAGLAVGAPLGVAPATAQPAPTTRSALLIGVNRFVGNTRPNYGAVNDVADTREMLIRAGWRSEDILVLTDEGARADDIRNGLRWLVDRSSPTSVSAFHYSGHVKQAGGAEFLWPHDNRFIRDTELASSLQQLQGRSWINISGCEAAGFDEGISSPTRLFTASSTATEKSYELVEAGKSVFTMLMVDQGMRKGLADENRDGRVSVQEAFRYAATRAPEITKGAANGPQHPVMRGGSGDFFFDEVATPPVAPTKTCGLNLLGLCLF